MEGAILIDRIANLVPIEDAVIVVCITSMNIKSCTSGVSEFKSGFGIVTISDSPVTEEFGFDCGSCLFLLLGDEGDGGGEFVSIFC